MYDISQEFRLHLIFNDIVFKVWNDYDFVALSCQYFMFNHIFAYLSLTIPAVMIHSISFHCYLALFLFEFTDNNINLQARGHISAVESTRYALYGSDD